MESELRNFRDILKDVHTKPASGPAGGVDASQYVMVDKRFIFSFSDKHIMQLMKSTRQCSLLITS